MKYKRHGKALAQEGVLIVITKMNSMREILSYQDVSIVKKNRIGWMKL